MEKFDLIFRGDLVLGHSLDEVKQRLQGLFKVDKARIDALFTGRPVALKRQLDSATATKYQQALHKAGAQVTLVPARESEAPPQDRTQPRNKTEQVYEGDTGTSKKGAGLSLAPREGYLVKPEEHKRPRPVRVAVSDLSLKPADGPLVDSDELGSESASAPATPDFEVAAVGADLLTPSERAATPSVVPEAGRWELAESGTDLLSPDQRQPSIPEVQVDSGLALVPGGGDSDWASRRHG